MNSNILQFSHLYTYKKPPEGSCNLPKLKILCEERLRLYKELMKAENMNLKRHGNNWTSYLYNTIINSTDLKTYKTLLRKSNSVDTLKAQRQDHIAHWFLSLCYSKNEILKNYFIQWELDWIALLYYTKTETILFDILSSNTLNYQKVKPKEKEQLKESLICCRSFINFKNFDKAEYFKTDFKNILNLVRDREVFITNGCAYFPKEDIIYLLECKLHFQFKEQLDWNTKMLPNVYKNEQFVTFLKLFSIYLPEQRIAPVINITLDNLDEVSKLYYPLCMRNIHNVLKTAHHLKHDCRMQYGIFLKNLGLPYEDAMAFFEQEFTKSMSKNWFDRKYAYYFKHYYGQVGGRIDYKPYSCKFIQEMSPASQEHHGCPFKHWDKDILIGEITKDGLGLSDIKDIEDLITEENYQDACTKYYCSVRKTYRSTIIESPNQYCADGFMIEKSLDNLLNSLCDSV